MAGELLGEADWILRSQKLAAVDLRQPTSGRGFQTPESMSSAPVLSPIRSTGTPTFSSIAV
jgi:hypothetical protein